MSRISSLKFLLVTPVFIVFGLLFFHGNAFAQACTTPGTPSNVLVTYPACQGVNCSGTQATCTWGAASDAASYSVQITEVDSNTVVTTQSLASSVLTYTFSVTGGKTYKCSVTAVNSCGTAGSAGTFSLLCETDVVVNPTAAPVATLTPIQEIPPTGNNFILLALVAAGGMIMFFGIALLRL